MGFEIWKNDVENLRLRLAKTVRRNSVFPNPVYGVKLSVCDFVFFETTSKLDFFEVVFSKKFKNLLSNSASTLFTAKVVFKNFYFQKRL